MFDAYTVKKVLPRLVIAAILIQLSWEIFTLMILIVGNIAWGVEGLLYAPFGGRDALQLEDLVAGSAGGPGLFAAVTAIAVVGAATTAVSLGVVLSLALSAFIAIAIGFFVLVVRQVVILVLLVLAPIALVAWILPNTEKVWKLWWESFSKLLFMYPLILLLIAAGRIFAVIATDVSDFTDENLFTNLAGNTYEMIIVVVGFFAPFFLIPKTFQVAGSAFANITGMVNNRSRGVFDRLRKGRQQSMSTKWERDGQRRIIQKRADWQNRLQTQASNRNRTLAGRLAARAGSKVIGGYNIQALQSAKQAQVAKELNDQIATGRDEEIRGLTVNKRAANDAGNLVLQADGSRSNGRMRINADGIRQYKSLGGRWIDEAAVDAAYTRWGNDTYAQQAALSYEMRKAMSDDQVEELGKHYQSVATGRGGWGMSQNQATGALTGAGFENQNQHLEFKHMNLDGSLRYDAFAQEAYEKKGSYPLAQMSAHTIEQLRRAHRYGNDETKRRVEAVAETFMSRFGGGSGVAALDDDGNPIPATPQGAGTNIPQSSYQANTPGAASVAEAVRRLAVDVGVYRPLDPSTDLHSATGPSPNPRQN